MEQVQGKKLTCKNVFHWINSALGTFLFVFFMMGSIFVFTTGINTSRWLLPYFILPAYLVCATFGMDYWVGDDRIRRWSYCVSTIISALVLLPETAFSIPSYAQMPWVRMIVTILLSILLSLYGIQKVRTKKAANQRIVASEEKLQVQRNGKTNSKVIRFICLLSICCVVLESWHRMITTLYGLVSMLTDIIFFSTFAQFPLGIFSIILLARFVKAEFIPRSALMEQDVS